MPRELGEVYFIWMEKSIMQYLLDNFKGQDLQQRIAVYTALAWIHNEFSGKEIKFEYAKMINNFSGVSVRKVREIVSEFEEAKLLKVRRTTDSHRGGQIKRGAVLIFDPSGSDIYKSGLRCQELTVGKVTEHRKHTNGLKELSIIIDRFILPITIIINNNCSNSTSCTYLNEYLNNFDYEKEIIPLIKKWNDIATESKGKISKHKIPETKEDAIASTNKTFGAIIQAIISLRTGLFVKSHKVITPHGYEDRPFSLEEISGVLHSVYLYFKNNSDYKTRFIPKSLAQFFYNTNPKSEYKEESYFLQTWMKPITPETLGGIAAIKKNVSQDIYDHYHFSLFHDIDDKSQTTLWYMIGKVYRTYYKIKTDTEKYYKDNQNWHMVFDSFEVFSSYHVDFLKQTYGYVTDIHVGFLATDKKVWSRFTETMLDEFGLIFHPTDVQRLELENKRYIKMVEEQGIDPDGFDDDFRTRENRIDHNRSKIINLQQKKAERSAKAT